MKPICKNILRTAAPPAIYGLCIGIVALSILGRRNHFQSDTAWGTANERRDISKEILETAIATAYTNRGCYDVLGSLVFKFFEIAGIGAATLGAAWSFHSNYRHQQDNRLQQQIIVQNRHFANSLQFRQLQELHQTYAELIISTKQLCALAGNANPNLSEQSQQFLDLVTNIRQAIQQKIIEQFAHVETELSGLFQQYEANPPPANLPIINLNQLLPGYVVPQLLLNLDMLISTYLAMHEIAGKIQQDNPSDDLSLSIRIPELKAAINAQIETLKQTTIDAAIQQFDQYVQNITTIINNANNTDEATAQLQPILADILTLAPLAHTLVLELKTSALQLIQLAELIAKRDEYQQRVTALENQLFPGINADFIALNLSGILRIIDQYRNMFRNDFLISNSEQAIVQALAPMLPRFKEVALPTLMPLEAIPAPANQQRSLVPAGGYHFFHDSFWVCSAGFTIACFWTIADKIHSAFNATNQDCLAPEHHPAKLLCEAYAWGSNTTRWEPAFEEFKNSNSTAIFWTFGILLGGIFFITMADLLMRSGCCKKDPATTPLLAVNTDETTHGTFTPP
jgi:hypothetical protein